MRSILVVVILAVLLVPSVQAQELMVPTAIASVGEYVYFAYPDSRLFFGHGLLQEVPCADRGIPIAALHPSSAGVLVLYEDNQVWLVDWQTGCHYRCDMTRPDNPRIRPIAISEGSGIVAFYEDGQVWNSFQQGLDRITMWERLDPLSAVGESGAAIVSAVSPNPASGPCRVAFRVPTEGQVTIEVLDVSGRSVRRLLAAEQPPGDYSLEWDGRDDEGRDLPAGVYFARITTPEGTTSGRVVLAR